MFKLITLIPMCVFLNKIIVNNFSANKAESISMTQILFDADICNLELMSFDGSRISVFNLIGKK